jgi:protein O-GlcNAc transferase
MNQTKLTDLLARGNLAFERGDIPLAIECYQLILAVNPDMVEARVNLALAYKKVGKKAEAIVQFREAVALDPTLFAIHYNWGNLYVEEGDFHQAIACFVKAAELKPDFQAVWTNLGISYSEVGLYDEADTALKRALALGPNETTYVCYVANLERMGQPTEAFHAYKRATQLVPGFHSPILRVNLYPIARSLLDWETSRVWEKEIGLLTNQELKQKRPVTETAYCCLMRSQDQKLNHLVACSQAHQAQAAANKVYDHTLIKTKKRKIRVGYISPDFTYHAVGQDIKHVFRDHDRSLVEIFAYSLIPPDTSEVYQFVAKHADHMVDLSGADDSQAALTIYEDHLDILVDLCGQTKHSRLGILAHKPAPIQVNYLGMPGTSGADFMDYMLADSVLIPREDFPNYSEQIVYLSGGYHFSSYAALTQPLPTRKSVGLPEKGIVFGCFNNAEKMDREIIEIWKAILNRVPGSVLWLIEPKPEAQNRLVSILGAQRLIFAPKIDMAGHLNRLRLVDIALDTPSCNGSSTTSDALYAGVPVITIPGKHYITRTTMSFLLHLGLNALVAENLAAYEDLAVRLATEQEALRKIKQQVKRAVAVSPLFDSRKMTAILERAYVAMWERDVQKLAPDHIW